MNDVYDLLSVDETMMKMEIAVDVNAVGNNVECEVIVDHDADEDVDKDVVEVVVVDRLRDASVCVCVRVKAISRDDVNDNVNDDAEGKGVDLITACTMKVAIGFKVLMFVVMLRDSQPGDTPHHRCPSTQKHISSRATLPQSGFTSTTSTTRVPS